MAGPSRVKQPVAAIEIDLINYAPRPFQVFTQIPKKRADRALE
jgi:hypothetical protein